jgi:hypothetical protein
LTGQNKCPQLQEESSQEKLSWKVSFSCFKKCTE